MDLFRNSFRSDAIANQASRQNQNVLCFMNPSFKGGARLLDKRSGQVCTVTLRHDSGGYEISPDDVEVWAGTGWSLPTRIFATAKPWSSIHLRGNYQSNRSNKRQIRLSA